MDKLSGDDEKRVMGAMERVVSLTNSGTGVNDAIIKVATEDRFSPPFVQRMVEAYNVSKTLSHFKAASGDKRAESFPLADTAVVLEAMYPQRVSSPAEKQAAVHVPSDYGRRESTNFMTKAAVAVPRLKVAALNPAVEEQSHKSIQRYEGLCKKADYARSAYRAAFVQTMDCVKTAAAHFHLSSHEPFAAVEAKIASTHGALGSRLMDLVYTTSGIAEKRATAEQIGRQYAFNLDAHPYKSFGLAIKQAGIMLDLAEAAVEAENTAETFRKSAGLPDPKAAPPETPSALTAVLAGVSPRPFEKSALGVGDILTAGAAIEGGKSALGLANDSEGAKRKATSEVFDPMHEAKMRGIHTQSMLNDFMSNDPIISSHDPDKVLTAFNQISQLTPHVATQPTVMRGMLRRMLQQENVLEPHEASQLTDIENKVQSRTAPAQ